MSSFTDRPPPDPQRFLHALADWHHGEANAGTTLQQLKRGGLDVLLADAGDDHDGLRQAWDAWERGQSPPAETLERLEAAGLPAFLEAVS